MLLYDHKHSAVACESQVYFDRLCVIVAPDQVPGQRRIVNRLEPHLPERSADGGGEQELPDGCSAQHKSPVRPVRKLTQNWPKLTHNWLQFTQNCFTRVPTVTQKTLPSQTICHCV